MSKAFYDTAIEQIEFQITQLEKEDDTETIIYVLRKLIEYYFNARSDSRTKADGKDRSVR